MRLARYRHRMGAEEAGLAAAMRRLSQEREEMIQHLHNLSGGFFASIWSGLFVKMVKLKKKSTGYGGTQQGHLKDISHPGNF